MATKTDKKKLTPAQAAAVDHLATGSSVTDAAAAVNASRQTVSGWLNDHPVFQAELNRRRAELWGAAADRLRALLPKALDRIAAAIDSEGPEGLTAAIALIRLARVEPLPAGPVDPEAVEVEAIEKAADVNRRRRFVGPYL